MKNPLDKRLLLLNSTSSLIERFITLFIQLWLYQYLIKRITPEEYSLYPVIMALVVFVQPLTSLLTAGISRFTIDADARGDAHRVTEITSTIFPVLVGSAVMLALFGALMSGFLGSIVNVAPGRLPEARVMLLLLFASVSLRLVLAPFSVGLYVRQKFVLANTLALCQAIVRLMLLFALLLGAGPRVLWVVVATVVADVSILLATTGLSVRAVPALRFNVHRIRWGLLKPLTSFGAWNVIGWLSHVIRTSADLLILNRLGTPLNVASFHLASLPDNQIGDTVQRAMSPLQPPMVALHARGDHHRLRRLHIRVGRYSLWATFLVVTPLVVFRNEFWMIYLGSAFEIYGDVPLVMTLVLLRYLVECPSHPTGMLGYAVNRMRAISCLSLLLSLTNVGITLYLVGPLEMGAVGSALGTLLATVLWHPLVMWRLGINLVGLSYWPWFKAVIGRGALPAVAAGMFGLALRQWVQPQTLPELLGVTAAIWLVYVHAILLFCLDDDERGAASRLVARGFKAVPWRGRVAPDVCHK